MHITLAIMDINGRSKAEGGSDGELHLVYRGEYEAGDCIRLTVSEPGYLLLAFDAAIAPSLLFMREREYSYPLPLGQQGQTISPVAFTGQIHRLFAREASHEEIVTRRNLAFNPLDTAANNALYPHASANVETRGEAAFAARNAIDGEKANTDHGKWPFTSWGINQDPQAELTIDFGREVSIDELKLYLRADFPHDAWWKQASVTFSDGSTEQLELGKSGSAQRFAVKPRRIEWLKLHDLIKADDPSPFPALTQFEAWGTEAMLAPIQSQP